MRTRLEIGRSAESNGRVILAAVVFSLVGWEMLLPDARAQEFDPSKAALDEVDQLNIVLRAEAEDDTTLNPATEIPAKGVSDLPTAAEVSQEPFPAIAPQSSNSSSGTSAFLDGRSSESAPASGGGTVEFQDKATNQSEPDVMTQNPLTLVEEFQFPASTENDASSLTTVPDGKGELDRLLLSKADAIAEKAVSDWTLQDFTAIKDRALESK